MKPPKPPPIEVPKDKPYRFSNWKWKGGKWTPVFEQTKEARQKPKREWREQSKRLNELDEMLDQRISD